MILARSFWRKAIVTVIAAGGFVSLYEVTMFDSKYAAWLPTEVDETHTPAPGDRLTFSASAYCKGITTTSGVAAQTGIAAADPSLLPVGSVVQADLGNPRYDGIYTVLDTGPGVTGFQIDLYMWSCYEALEFGRKPLTVTVLRLGWSPRATTPSILGRLFGRPSNPPASLPSRPFPQELPR